MEISAIYFQYPHTHFALAPFIKALGYSKSSFFLLFFFFNWRIITLQCRVASCHTATWISHEFIYIYTSPRSWASLLPTPIPPLQVITETRPSSCVIQQLPTNYPFYIWWCIYFTDTSQFLSFFKFKQCLWIIMCFSKK